MLIIFVLKTLKYFFLLLIIMKKLFNKQFTNKEKVNISHGNEYIRQQQQ